MPKGKNKGKTDIKDEKKQTEITALSGTSWADSRIILILAVIYIIGLVAVLTVPQLEPALIPAETFWLFGLSLQAIFLLFGTGIVILYNWFRNPYSPLKVWSVSFVIYSLTFIGLLLHSLGAIDEKIPVVFFMFRNSMIIWAAGMIYGLATHLGFGRKLKHVIPSLILTLGYSWFAWGLLLVADIEYTMYGFLYFIFIPVCVYLSWAFYRAARTTGFTSFKYISLGMMGLAITYGAWAPWHQNYIYAVWFFMFNLSLVPIFAGFTGLFQESRYLKLIRMGI
jgi:hypothetical protein